MIYLLLLALPHLIWQTDKTKDLSPRALETRQTWIDLNPGYRYSLYDDADIETYIQQKWPPEYLAFFHALPLGVMKADLWRYLVLTTEGGIYSDIDSVCLIPIRDWQVRDRPHVLLIDTDSDTGQFCQWTFAATPHHPALEFLCNYALKRWQKRGITHCADGSIDVLGATGPTLFSNALKRYIGESKGKPASRIIEQYRTDKKYRKKLNKLGIFFTPHHFFHDKGSHHLSWGSWRNQVQPNRY